MEHKERVSNYEQMKESMAETFLQYSQDAMIKKFELEYDKDYIYIFFLNRKYRINRLNGRVTWSMDLFETEEDGDYNEVMTIYDVLCYSKENCHLAHEWVNTGSLSTVQGGTLDKGSDFYRGSGEFFDGKTAALSRACEALGGRKLNRGDVAYELDLFPFLPLALCFWESDEDFSASLQLFTDKNILDFMHYETLMFAIGHVLRRLKEEMQLGFGAD